MENPDMENMDMAMPAPADDMASAKMSEPMSNKMSEPKSKKSEPKDEESKPLMEMGMGAAAAGAAGEALGLNAFGGQSDGSDNTLKREPVRTDCCCCLCNCSNELTQGVKCCFCFPIKTGIVLVGIIVFFISFVQFTNAYMQLANATIPWWKPAVTILLFTPGFIGTCFFIGWFTKDCTRTRATLTPAVIQGLTSYVLILLWQIIYFFAIEKKELVGSGFGDDLKTYSWQSKKHFIYWQLAYGVLAISFYILAISAVRAYVNCYPDQSEYKKNEKKQ